MIGLKRVAIDAVVRATAECLVARGPVEVWGDGVQYTGRDVNAIVKAARQFDDCHFAQGDQWVYFVFANAPGSVISDYAMEIEPIIQPALDLAGRIDRGDFIIDATGRRK